MFSLLVFRLCRLNLVLLSVVMVNLLPSSVLLTSVLSIWHCPLVLEIILQSGALCHGDPFNKKKNGYQNRMAAGVYLAA